MTNPRKKVTKETAVRRAMQRLREVADEPDKEHAHAVADDALCGLLEDLGHPRVVKLFEKLEKWYG